MKYELNDAICIDCIADKCLREYVKEENNNHICVECGNNNISITIEKLAEYIDLFIRKYFQHGEYERRYDMEDDGYWEEQRGEDLLSTINMVCGQDFKFVDVIADILIQKDFYDPRGGEEPFYDLDIYYIETKIHFYDMHERWEKIEKEIKTKRRFFSNSARVFFEWLFDDIENLHFYNHQNNDNHLERYKSVVHNLPIGTKFFRARRADTLEMCKKYIDNAINELSPPPAKYAKEGRMNANGVSIFYAAYERDTCIAEMRSSIGSFVVLGEFKIVKSIQILDFSYFEEAIWKNSSLSYFQDDFEEQVGRRRFLSEIHRLISKPIISGHEDDYLMTQVLAEYIAYVHPKKFDGLLFKSTQHENGKNIVIFSKENNNQIYHQENLIMFPLEFVSNSIEIHKIAGISYSAKKINFSNSNDHLYIKRDYDEDY